MILNAHTYYSLRYGVLSPEELVLTAKSLGYTGLALTDINNTTAIFDVVKLCREHNIKPVSGAELRDNTYPHCIAIARNNEGFREINEWLTQNAEYENQTFPEREWQHTYIIFPYETKPDRPLKENEFIGIRPSQINKIKTENRQVLNKSVVLLTSTFNDFKGFETHKRLRAIDYNILLSQLEAPQTARTDEYLLSKEKVMLLFSDYPEVIANTEKIINDCSFHFDFSAIKNKKHYTSSHYEDKLLLEKLAYDGMIYRYGSHNKTARSRIESELRIIDSLGFSAYFLIAADIIRYSLHCGFYHVGRGSGANSIVAYCLRITDVCPIELDLYFERFLNPKRKSPPDFDIDYSWKERDKVTEYIFRRYGKKHTALLGAMSTFRDRSIIREMGKVYGLPKEEIDHLIKYPESALNQNSLCSDILVHYGDIENFPNIRSIHAGGILISEEPITCYTALDMPPKGFPTTQFDMYVAEDIGFEKLDILSQRGIGHIKDAAGIILKNTQQRIDIHDVQKFKNDAAVRQRLESGKTIGCFYIESPAMRGLLQKLHCSDYLTLVAASSIIRPGVARSGMMKEYISRFHRPEKCQYPHPILEQQLKETYGVMVYQEDVLKVGHHFGGLDLADADVLRRMMSGKTRNKKHLDEIKDKYFAHCKQMNYGDEVSQNIWRQIESFAGYSFSKAHSASYAVESFQSLYLKTYFPLEFMVAVINNFGGFYTARTYLNEARKAGGNIHLPCVNHSEVYTTIYGKDIYIGFVHIKSLEHNLASLIVAERQQNGAFADMEDFIRRTACGLESLRILIRINAFRFTQSSKATLLWQAHMLFHKEDTRHNAANPKLFKTPNVSWDIPPLVHQPIEDAYDELELLEFTVSMSPFDMLKTSFRGECMAESMKRFINKKVRMVGNYVTYKWVRTIRGETMAFGTFLDVNGDFFDTTHFPPCLKEFPFKGNGVYLIMGKIVEEFGFPSMEVEKMAKLPVHSDPRMM